MAKLHDLNIIHEDLTSSNMMIRKEDKKLVISSPFPLIVVSD